jgi:hypothetical protein
MARREENHRAKHSKKRTSLKLHRSGAKANSRFRRREKKKARTSFACGANN